MDKKNEEKVSIYSSFDWFSNEDLEESAGITYPSSPIVDLFCSNVSSFQWLKRLIEVAAGT